MTLVPTLGSNCLELPQGDQPHPQRFLLGSNSRWSLCTESQASPFAATPIIGDCEYCVLVRAAYCDAALTESGLTPRLATRVVAVVRRFRTGPPPL